MAIIATAPRRPPPAGATPRMDVITFTAEAAYMARATATGVDTIVRSFPTPTRAMLPSARA